MTDSKVVSIREKVEARRREEEEKLSHLDKHGDGGDGQPPITGKFVRQCLANNERGDGILYATLQRDKFIYNKATDAWMIYQGHHWELDHLNRAVTAVEDVANAYLAEAEKLAPLLDESMEHLRTAKAEVKAADKALKAAQKKLDSEAIDQAKAALATAEELLISREDSTKSLKAEYKSFLDRAKRLRTVKGANNCLTWAHCVEDPLACKGDEFDRHPMLLACDNGVVDLRTGHFREGRPADMILRASPVPWPVDFEHLEAYLRCEDVPSPCPAWENQFFPEIHQEDPEVIDFHGRYLGYVITGLTHEQFYICWGGEGANGKGVMGDTVGEVLGPLSWDISPELILEQKNTRSSAGPSADLISLMGRRLVIASESDEGRRVSTAMIKRLTGQERLTARSPHEKYEITFEPVFKMIFRFNAIPHGMTKDFAMVRRLIYIHYPLIYVDNPESDAEARPDLAPYFRKIDRGLRDKLRAQKPGILAWLVRECLKYQRDGLRPPDKIKAAVDQLRKEEDYFGRFFEESPYERGDSDDWVTFKEIYGAFEKWYEENINAKDKYLPSKKAVSARLVKMGFLRDSKGGQAYFYGVRLPAGVV